MSISQQLKILAVKKEISIAEMARICGKSPQAFWQKMKRESFTPDELQHIAQRVGCKYKQYFELETGEKI